MDCRPVTGLPGGYLHSPSVYRLYTVYRCTGALAYTGRSRRTCVLQIKRTCRSLVGPLAGTHWVWSVSEAGGGMDGGWDCHVASIGAGLAARHHFPNTFRFCMAIVLILLCPFLLPVACRCSLSALLATRLSNAFLSVVFLLLCFFFVVFVLCFVQF